MTESPDITYPQGRNIAILRSGEILPTGQRNMSPSEIVAQIRDVVTRPYCGKDASKIGMCLLEAALVAAAESAADGNLDALNKILDRLMGKPVQQTITASGTLREFLDELANSDTKASGSVDPLDD